MKKEKKLEDVMSFELFSRNRNRKYCFAALPEFGTR